MASGSTLQATAYKPLALKPYTPNIHCIAGNDFQIKAWLANPDFKSKEHQDGRHEKEYRVKMFRLTVSTYV